MAEAREFPEADTPTRVAGRGVRALAILAQARLRGGAGRVVIAWIVGLIATSVVGNLWPLYWCAGVVIVALVDRRVFGWLHAQCARGVAPVLTGPICWVFVQSLYGVVLAAILWFAPYMPGETLAVMYMCGLCATTMGTLRASPPLAAASFTPIVVGLLGLPLAEYGMAGASNPLLLIPFVGGLLLLGFGLHLWRTLQESDAAQARAEAAVLRERQAAAAGAAAKSDAIRRMNDELRTPMQALIGAAEHLRRAAATPQARAQIGTLVEAGEVLKLVLSDLADLDRLENGQLRITPAPADPREIVRGVAAAFRSAAQDKQLELFVDVGATPARVEIDAHRVRQILFNLLANAVRYTGHGGVRVSVAARASETPGQVRLHFVVADTGAGMSRAQIARVLGRERLTPGGEGPGLGLAISRRLAKLMGARLTVKSELGQGSAFTLTLEARVSAAVEAA